MDDPLLFIVEIAFQISNRGCVLAPGPSTEWTGAPIRVGSPIRLLTPEGRLIETHIRGIELLNYGSRRPEKFTAPILLPPSITKDQVPPGTKVFLLAGENANGHSRRTQEASVRPLNDQ